jgi:hypothetical protein
MPQRYFGWMADEVFERKMCVMFFVGLNDNRFLDRKVTDPSMLGGKTE